jgi:hypothetical protein
MSTKADKLVADYLKRLDGELRGLPHARRRELVEEISDHIASARAELDAEDEARIRTLLDSLGDPADIAAEARERFGVQPRRRGLVEVGALILLPVGGVLLPVVGWFVGALLLWISDAWSTRDKLVGTFVIPGGLLVPLGLLFVSTGSGGGACVETSTGAECTTDSMGAGDALVIALIVVLLLAPLASAAYLAQRLRRPSQSVVA